MLFNRVSHSSSHVVIRRQHGQHAVGPRKAARPVARRDKETEAEQTQEERLLHTQVHTADKDLYVHIEIKESWRMCFDGFVYLEASEDCCVSDDFARAFCLYRESGHVRAFCSVYMTSVCISQADRKCVIL